MDRTPNRSSREKLKKHERLCERTMAELRVVVSWIEK